MTALPLVVLLLTGTALPDGNAFVQGLAAKQRAREEMLNQYTYDSFNVKEDLEKDGRIRERHTRAYEIFYVQGRPVRRRVAEDGQRLSGKKQEQSEKEVAEQIAKIREKAGTRDEYAVRLSEVLERYDFRTVAREDLAGRPTIVLDFTPRPGKRDIDGDGSLRQLNGRIWVDEADHQLVQAEVRNIGSLKVGWGLLASVGELSMKMRFSKVNGEVWLPQQDEILLGGRALLFLKGFRMRVTRTYGNYRRFEVDVEETANAPGAAPAP